MSNFRASDTIYANAATAYVTIDGIMHEAFYAKTFEANIEKSKVDVRILGERMLKHKTAGVSGSGTMTIHYVSPFYRKMLEKYKDTGIDTYFTICVNNDDPESTVGSASTMFYDVNIDGGVLAKFDSAGETLEEDVSFTFDDYKHLSTFKEAPQH